MIEEILGSFSKKKKKKHWSSGALNYVRICAYFLGWRRRYGFQNDIEQIFSLEFLKIFVYIVSSPDTVSPSNSSLSGQRTDESFPVAGKSVPKIQVFSPIM
jgi:hypothetical protein